MKITQDFYDSLEKLNLKSPNQYKDDDYALYLICIRSSITSHQK